MSDERILELAVSIVGLERLPVSIAAKVLREYGDERAKAERERLREPTNAVIEAIAEILHARCCGNSIAVARDLWIAGYAAAIRGDKRP